MREPEQAVRLARHGAHDHDDLVPLALHAERALRDIFHALEVRNRSTAELLNDEGQGAARLPLAGGRVNFAVKTGS